MIIEDYYPLAKFSNTKRVFKEVPLYEPIPQNLLDKSRSIVFKINKSCKIRFHRHSSDGHFNIYFDVFDGKSYESFHISYKKDFENKEDIRAELYDLVKSQFFKKIKNIEHHAAKSFEFMG